MAKYRVYMKTDSFTDNNGNIIPFKRLILHSTIFGKPVNLELKLNKEQVALAELILSSNEDLNVESRKATDDELDDFYKKNRSKSSDKIDLESEDD